MRVLMIAHVASHPGASGNGARIKALAENIESLGHELHFLYLPQTDASFDQLRSHWRDRLHLFRIKRFPTTPYPRVFTASQRLDQLLRMRICVSFYYRLVKANVIIYRVDDWYDDHLNPFLESLQSEQRFDAVITAYVFNSKALTRFPASVRKVIDTHDVFADRHQRFFAAGDMPSWFFTTRSQEERGLKRADVVIAIQRREADYFGTLQLGATRVVTVGHTVQTCERAEEPIAGGAPAILFLGSDNPMNRDALRHLQDSIYPKVRTAIPECTLIIAGSVSRFARQDPNTLIKGVVEDLAPMYRAATVVINPVRFGTGLKIKSVEAMAHGKPLITTSVGIEGMPVPAEEACIVADAAEGMADACLRLLRDGASLERLSRNALAYAHQLNQQTASSVAEIFS